MSKLEVSHWTAPATEDLGQRRCWTKRNASPDFPESVLATVGPVVAEPSVRASAIDIAPEPVVGLILQQDQSIVFCFCTESDVQVELWIASTKPDEMAGHKLTRLWFWAVSSGTVDYFDWQGPVDSSVLEQPTMDRPFNNGSGTPDTGTEVPIAVRDENRERRLNACCILAEKIQSKGLHDDPAQVVVMDNLTVVGGHRFQIAGLVPSHRYADSHWQIFDISDKQECDKNLGHFKARVLACSVGSTTAHADNSSLSGIRGDRPNIRRKRKDGSVHITHGYIRHARDAFYKAIEAKIAAHPNKPSIDIARELFNNPKQLAIDHHANVSTQPPFRFEVDMIARGLVLAREPALVVDTRTDLASWLEYVMGTNLALEACVAAEMQPLYDHFRALIGDQRQAYPLSGVDRMLDNVIVEIDKLATAQEGDPGNESLSDLLVWLGREGLVAVFDRLGELETMSHMRDQALLRAQALVRLMVDLPTPDVIDRTVRTAFKENATPLHALLRRNLFYKGLIEIAVIAASDERDLSLDQGYKLLCQMIGLDIEVEKDRESVALFKSFESTSKSASS